MVRSVTHYETLGVPRAFAPEQLTARWRELTRAMHPDRLGGTAEANAAFAEVTAAYAVLSDPERRVAYDASLDLLTDPCPGCGGEGQVWRQRGFTGRTAAICGGCGGAGRVGRR